MPPTEHHPTPKSPEHLNILATLDFWDSNNPHVPRQSVFPSLCFFPVPKILSMSSMPGVVRPTCLPYRPRFFGRSKLRLPPLLSIDNALGHNRSTICS